MFTLGINAVFHDSAACLVKDGVVLAAAEEERFTHVKHAKRPVPFTTYELPYHAIAYCLQHAGLRLTDVAHVAYSFCPSLLLGRHAQESTIQLPLQPSAQALPAGWDSVWDPLFISYVRNAPRQLADGAPHHLKRWFAGYQPTGSTSWHYVPHHLSHAASAFHASPFEHAAVLTLDGRGEKATTSYSVGHGNSLTSLGQVCMPHSLGLLYEEVTEHLGFLRSSDEYKVMALAALGKPRFMEQFREMVQLGTGGHYTVANTGLAARLGEPRPRGALLTSLHHDIACSLQAVLEETVLHLARWLQTESQQENLCMAGGVALNCVMNARLRDDGPFKRIWVQPAAGDAGTALGAALWIDALRRRDEQRHWQMDHAYLGPEFQDFEMEEFIRWTRVPYQRLDDVAGTTADLLVEGKIVGWFQGRMEFGPRALGARSILASPLHADMQQRLNDLKDREDFRPVAPAVLEEEAAEWFHIHEPSPFMLFIHKVRKDKASRIPAACHVDGTARIQTVNRQHHPLYHRLIQAFQARTGVPVLVNTSFNTRGEPIVCTPRDALEAFWTSSLDALVMGSFLIKK